MYNLVNTLAPSLLIESSSFLQVTNTNMKSVGSSKFSLIVPCTAELAALERLKISPVTYNGRNVVNTLAPSFSIKSSSFLRETMAFKAWLSSNINQIQPLTTKLPASKRLKSINSSALQVTGTTIRSRMISKFDQIRPSTAELAAFERLKIFYLHENY